MIRRHTPLVAFALIVIALPAAAQGIGAAGTYRGSGASLLSAKVKAGSGPGSFSGSFSVKTRGCTGEVDASGRRSGPQEIVFAKRDDGGSVCRITMRFGPGYRAATVSESDCLYWHGTACSFDGKLKRAGR